MTEIHFRFRSVCKKLCTLTGTQAESCATKHQSITGSMAQAFRLCEVSSRYSIAIVAVFDITPPIVSTTGTAGPLAAVAGTSTFT